MTLPSQDELLNIYNSRLKTALDAFENIGMNPSNVTVSTIAHDVADQAVRQTLNECGCHDLMDWRGR